MTIDDGQARLLDEKRVVTGRISDTCRYVGLGLLAVFYLIKTGDSPLASWIANAHPYLLLSMAAAGALTILVDYFQYMAGAIAVGRALKRSDYMYQTEWRSYQIRNLAYKAKQWISVIGVLLLFALMILAELSSLTPTNKSSGLLLDSNGFSELADR